jgi:hypothetical protein
LYRVITYLVAKILEELFVALLVSLAFCEPASQLAKGWQFVAGRWELLAGCQLLPAAPGPTAGGWCLAPAAPVRVACLAVLNSPSLVQHLFTCAFLNVSVAPQPPWPAANLVFWTVALKGSWVNFWLIYYITLSTGIGEGRCFRFGPQLIQHFCQPLYVPGLMVQTCMHAGCGTTYGF